MPRAAGRGRLPEGSPDASRDSEGNNHDDAAEQDPGGVAADIAGLHEAKAAADLSRERADAIDKAIDQPDIGPAPEDDAGAIDQRLDDSGVVDLIHEVFVVDQGVEAPDAADDGIG